MNNLQEIFRHRLIDNKVPKTIFLLHGTGGTENDLFNFVEPFHKTHNIIGLLGNTTENSMARFFERDASGVPIMESINVETEKLKNFIELWLIEHDAVPADITYVGYSNGANMIITTMFLYPELITKMALLHPFLPFQPKEDLNLSKNRILLSWSPEDTIIPKNQSREIIEVLQKYHADLDIIETSSGHSITQDEVIRLQKFIQ